MSSPYTQPPHNPTPSQFGPAMNPPRKKSIGLIMLIGLVALCGIAGAVLAVVTLGNDQTPEANAEPAKESQDPVVVSPIRADGKQAKAIPSITIDKAEKPLQVEVSIQTEPPGAEVFSTVTQEVIGTTPLDVKIDKGDGTEKWRIYLEGYEIQEIDVTLDSYFQYNGKLVQRPPEAPPQKPAVLKSAAKDAAKAAGSAKTKADARKAAPKDSGDKNDEKKTATSSAKDEQKKKTAKAPRKKDRKKDKKKDKEKSSGGTRAVISTPTGAAIPD